MRSLRGRLTLGLSVVLAGVLAVAAMLVARDVQREERAALDDRLIRTAELSRATALAAVQEELPAGDGRLDAVLRATGSSLRLLLADRVLLETGVVVSRGRRLPRGLSTFTHRGVRYRSYATSLRDESLGGLAQLEVTTRLTALERRQARLERRLAVLGAAAVLVAAAGVFLAASLVLRPLRRLRSATAGIAGDQDLDRRVPSDDGPSELRELARAFNAMLARLGRSAADRERALEATRRFAADAGHELRTPLTSAQATLFSLAEHPELPRERRVVMAREALEAHRRLVVLLDGLQLLARGDAAPAHGLVDLAELADEALAAVSARHPEVDWEADIPEGAVTVDGWGPGLRSLVENLLENAAVHGRDGRAGARVRLQVAPGALAVEDDGPGVPAAERERIFEPFVRGEDAGAPGSGLGLAIVHQQARHHGAEVSVGTSARLGGARFDVRFG